MSQQVPQEQTPGDPFSVFDDREFWEGPVARPLPVRARKDHRTPAQKEADALTNAFAKVKTPRVRRKR